MVIDDAGLKRGDLPYQKQQAFKAALKYNPNVVVIMLGTNEAAYIRLGMTKANYERFEEVFQ